MFGLQGWDMGSSFTPSQKVKFTQKLEVFEQNILYHFTLRYTKFNKLLINVSFKTCFSYSIPFSSGGMSSSQYLLLLNLIISGRKYWEGSLRTERKHQSFCLKLQKYIFKLKLNFLAESIKSLLLLGRNRFRQWGQHFQTEVSTWRRTLPPPDSDESSRKWDAGNIINRERKNSDRWIKFFL